jgi:hypothetical protein
MTVQIPTFTYPVAGTPITLTVEGAVFVKSSEIAALAGVSIKKFRAWEDDYNWAEFGILPSDFPNDPGTESSALTAVDFLKKQGNPQAANDIEQIDEAFHQCPLLRWVAQGGDTNPLT